ncbi:MAG: hypothetical protein ABH874_06930 [Methanobacteriota archaeon]
MPIRKIGIRYVLGWLLGAFFIFVGLGGMTISTVSGLLTILGALLILPPFGEFLEKKLKIVLTSRLKFGGFLILLVIGFGMILGLSMGPTESPTMPAVVPISKTTPKKEFVNLTYDEFNLLTEVRKELLKGKYVQWECMVYDVSNDLKMDLICEYWQRVVPDAKVTLRQDQRNKAMELSKESIVEFKARLASYGIFGGTTFLDDGIIVSMEK